MKLTFSASFSSKILCSGNLDAIIKALSGHKDAASIISEIKEMAAVSFAYKCQSCKIGAYRINQEIRGGKLWFEVQEFILVTPHETVSVDNAAEAMAVCKARSFRRFLAGGEDRIDYLPVQKLEGGKRNRIDTEGKIHTCGRARGFGFSEDILEKTSPVIAFFESPIFSATLWD